MVKAAAHHASRSEGSAKPPTIQRTPAKESHTPIRWKLRRICSDSWRTAHKKNSVLPTCIATYAHANTIPRAPNACGIEAERSKPSSISANKAALTGALSGSSQLVTQVVKIHSHQTATSSRPT